MKRNIITAVFLIMLVALQSCKKESQYLSDLSQDKKMITISANTSEVTKVEYDKVVVDNATKYRPRWNEGDEIALSVNGMAENQNCRFIKNADENKFSGEVTPWEGLKDVYIAYPYAERSIADCKLVIDQSNTTIKVGANNYDNSLLYGVIKECSSDNAIDCVMKQAMAIVKMKITNVPSAVKVVKVGMYADATDVLMAKATLQMETGSLSSPTYASTIEADVEGSELGTDTYVNLGIIPTHGSAHFSFHVTLSNGFTYYKHLSSLKQLNGNTIYTVNFSIDTSIDYLEFGPGFEIAGVVWAPVNCGYAPASGDNPGHPMGLLYQWGRKDGFGYNKKFKDINGKQIEQEIDNLPTTSASATDKEAYLYPDQSTMYSDWNPLKYELENLWSNPKNEIYDPCPAGWRVPTLEEVKSLTAYCQLSTNYGFYYYRDATKKGPYILMPHAGMYINAGLSAGFRFDGRSEISTRYFTTTCPRGVNYGSLLNQRYWVDITGETSVHAFPLRCVKILTPEPASTAVTTINYPSENNDIDF